MRGRPSSGGVRVRELAEGPRAYELRFNADGGREGGTPPERSHCDCGCGVGWNERAARRELADVRARVRAGVWERETPPPKSTAPERPPTFHEYASQWL